MKFLVFALCACVASVSCGGVPKGVLATLGGRAARSSVDQANKEWDTSILRSQFEDKPDGYSFGYETSGGIKAEAVGSLKKVDDVETIAVKGSYGYVAPDGTPVELQYVADENGFQPSSNLLPVAPAIPEAILRSLQYIAEHPQQVEAGKKF